MSEVIQLDNATFRREVLESEVPVLVDFTAQWCSPCQHIAPVMEELAQEFAGAVKVASIDTDDNHDIAAQYGIQGLPTIMLFRGGEEIARTGAKSKESYKNWVGGHIQA